SSKGDKRAVALRYPTRQSLQPLRHDGVLVEIGHWGGTYPHERHAVRSLIAEHGPSLGIDESVEEFTPFEVEVLDPVRTAVEKLMLLHAAAASDAERRLVVARHYYDVWRLLQDERISRTLADSMAVATMARDVETFTRAAGLPSRGRPADGFAASEAFDPNDPANQPTRAVYETVVLDSLLWAGSARPDIPPVEFEAAYHHHQETSRPVGIQ
ncbi:MAG: nucleotidyl transferase AbiEii/AbiGii toxin family protein, partial [Nitriliruptor sp.]|uniref:nucleotidyl transferase AbiEii/AbiGii toxin family protein n=1 Tax=Nitriliruptor sp. TaxID=2448056 RepID=UPI0034A02214